MVHSNPNVSLRFIRNTPSTKPSGHMCRRGCGGDLLNEQSLPRPQLSPLPPVMPPCPHPHPPPPLVLTPNPCPCLCSCSATTMGGTGSDEGVRGAGAQGPPELPQ